MGREKRRKRDSGKNKKQKSSENKKKGGNRGRRKARTSLCFITSRILTSSEKTKYIRSLEKKIVQHRKDIKKLRDTIKKLEKRLEKLQKEYKWNGGKKVRNIQSDIKKHEKELAATTRIFAGEEEQDFGLFGFPRGQPIEQVAPDVVYMDLFTMPCKADSIASLRTQYVRNS